MTPAASSSTETTLTSFTWNMAGDDLGDHLSRNFITDKAAYIGQITKNNSDVVCLFLQEATPAKIQALKIGLSTDYSVVADHGFDTYKSVGSFFSSCSTRCCTVVLKKNDAAVRVNVSKEGLLQASECFYKWANFGGAYTQITVSDSNGTNEVSYNTVGLHLASHDRSLRQQQLRQSHQIVYGDPHESVDFTSLEQRAGLALWNGDFNTRDEVGVDSSVHRPTHADISAALHGMTVSDDAVTVTTYGRKHQSYDTAVLSGSERDPSRAACTQGGNLDKSLHDEHRDITSQRLLVKSCQSSDHLPVATSYTTAMKPKHEQVKAFVAALVKTVEPDQEELHGKVMALELHNTRDQQQLAEIYRLYRILRHLEIEFRDSLPSSYQRDLVDRSAYNEIEGFFGEAKADLLSFVNTDILSDRFSSDNSEYAGAVNFLGQKIAARFNPRRSANSERTVHILQKIVNFVLSVFGLAIATPQQRVLKSMSTSLNSGSFWQQPGGIPKQPAFGARSPDSDRVVRVY